MDELFRGSDMLQPIILLAIASAAGQADDRRTVEVSQVGRRFHPAAVSIPEGATISVLNDDRFTHHVFYRRGAERFDSGEQPPGKTVEMTMNKAGEYEIECAIHPKMRLKVQVLED
jgi:plastocyanin